MTAAQHSPMVTARRSGNPMWTGFVATAVNQVKSFYRQPGALIFTLGQPLALLIILDAFNFSVALGERRTLFP
ncbi:MAG: hypothetical protein U5Q44_05625 [Dehalococcoidia bacterium]|nr:hypothetical protein [Dehalococcoidia bacterium]